MPGQTEGRKDGQKDRRTDPILLDPRGYRRGSKKSIKFISEPLSLIYKKHPTLKTKYIYEYLNISIRVLKQSASIKSFQRDV